MAVLTLHIQRQFPLSNGQAFGDAGPYEVLEGVARFSLDPHDPANAAITDLALAPRNADGLVAFNADLRILRPAGRGRGSRKLLVDIINRGNSIALPSFNYAGRGSSETPGPNAGDGYLMRQGYTVLQCGWQFDVASSPGTLTIQVPEAKKPDGSPLTGRIVFTFQVSAPAQVQELFPGIHLRSLPYDLSSPDAVLTEREYESAEPRVVPRHHWQFARLERGQPKADASYVYLPSGFAPGKTYQAIYPTRGAHISGVGLAAVRDMTSFLKYAPSSAGNPCTGNLDHALGFGVSQTGRFIRLFLYQGLNVDEQGRQVFDGFLGHIGGGRRAEFNRRFPQLTSSSKRTVSYFFPFTDLEQRDPLSGRVGGLMTRQKSLGGVPKVFFTNTAAEYYGSLGSLVHTNLEGAEDVPHGDEVRIYQFSSMQHGSGNAALNDRMPDGTRLRQPANFVDYRPLLRAALANLAAWVGDGVEPPPSAHPRISDGTLVKPEVVAETYSRIPGVHYPVHLRALTPADYQVGFDEAMAAGADPERTVEVGIGFTNLVAAVDADGNEVGGIRMPDVSVPVATHTGWNVRHPDVGGAHQMVGLTGSTIPFAATRAQREATRDPRPSLEERYASRDDYLMKVRQAAEALVAQRRLLAEDVDRVVQEAGRRYDLVAARAPQPAPAPAAAARDD